MSVKPTFEGEQLILPDWKYSGRDARVPHRRSVLAEYTDGRNKFFVCRNHRSFRGLWWVHATGYGFAGENSRASHTCATRNETLAAKWIAAVQQGRVKIAE